VQADTSDPEADQVALETRPSEVQVASQVAVRTGYIVGAATGLGAGASLVWLLSRKARGRA
jgi:hypothetical protein